MALAVAAFELAGCAATMGDPCTELCDGIVRCRIGNAECVAAGMTARDPFMADCVAVCEDVSGRLLPAERAEGLECVDCLREQTDFAECNGEMLLDATCASTCRNDGSRAFRDMFYPTLFDDYGCLGNP